MSIYISKINKPCSLWELEQWKPNDAVRCCRAQASLVPCPTLRLTFQELEWLLIFIPFQLAPLTLNFQHPSSQKVLGSGSFTKDPPTVRTDLEDSLPHSRHSSWVWIFSTVILPSRQSLEMYSSNGAGSTLHPLVSDQLLGSTGICYLTSVRATPYIWPYVYIFQDGSHQFPVVLWLNQRKKMYFPPKFEFIIGQQYENKIDCHHKHS